RAWRSASRWSSDRAPAQRRILDRTARARRSRPGPRRVRRPRDPPCGPGAIVRHVERRQRVLLPLVLRSIGNVAAVPILKESLRPFDRRMVRNLLMQLAMDRREQDAADVACLYDQLGLLEREIRCLFALRSRTRRRAAANLGLLRPAAAVDPLLELLD